MKNILIIASILLVGCSTTPTDSVSRDRTMADMAKTALINEMLNSPDQAVRLEGARIAKEFVVPKKRLFDF